MTPDCGYRRSVRRLLAVSWLLAVVLSVGGLVILDRFPVSGVIAELMAIGCLRMAAEVHDEIRRWPRPTYAQMLAEQMIEDLRVENRKAPRCHVGPHDRCVVNDSTANARNSARFEIDENGAWRQVSEWG